jgi:large subunit ribosomal protein L25
MKKVSLPLHDRDKLGKSESRRFRRSGKIPCVIYGHGEKARPCYVEKKDWEEIPVSDVHIVELSSLSGTVNALIKDIQFDYLKDETLHIDFQEVRMDELVVVKVPIHGKGVPMGVSKGGFLEQVLHELELECLPKDIPSFIEVDISGLDLEKSINIGGLPMPEGVKATAPTTTIVFHVLVPKAEEEVAATPAEGEAAAGAEPELVGGKGKEEEEGETEDAAASPTKEDKTKGKDKDKEKEKK